MAIWNLGSINVDQTYRVVRLPGPGETIAALGLVRGLGGKGANMSVAAAQAGAKVHHIGAIGADGEWARDRLESFGVDIECVKVSAAETGHAIILVDDGGENSIVLNPGANTALGLDHITAALDRAEETDIFLCQNETNNQTEAARLAKGHGMFVVYAAAPFDARAVAEVMPYLDLLVLNSVEADQLSSEMQVAIPDLHIPHIVVTLGGDGSRHFDNLNQKMHKSAAIDVKPVDTTGAGDTFSGYLIAGLDQGLSMSQSIARAGIAGGIMVTRHGTADVIPSLDDVDAYHHAHSLTKGASSPQS